MSWVSCQPCSTLGHVSRKKWKSSAGSTPFPCPLRAHSMLPFKCLDFLGTQTTKNWLRSSPSNSPAATTMSLRGAWSWCIYSLLQYQKRQGHPWIIRSSLSTAGFSLCVFRRINKKGYTTITIHMIVVWLSIPQRPLPQVVTSISPITGHKPPGPALTVSRHDIQPNPGTSKANQTEISHRNWIS
jgi:hypothetical protein